MTDDPIEKWKDTVVKCDGGCGKELPRRRMHLYQGGCFCQECFTRDFGKKHSYIA